MANELTARENTGVALSKSKSFMNVIKNIFNNKVIVDDDSWIQELLDWADEHNIPEKWMQYGDDDGFWDGLPRDKNVLLALDSLSLTNYEIEKIPKEIGNLNNLSGLFLAQNKLSKLPKEIGNLLNLQNLSIRKNKLKILPKEIGKLKKLIDIDLSENQLIELPKEVATLNKLESINLDENNLITLPSEIENLTSLTNLSIWGNELIKLPKEIGKLVSLIKLDLTSNHLVSLPKEIGDIIALKELNLLSNKLSHLPKEIGNLVNMIDLSFNGNDLSELPDEITNLIKIKKLDLRHNTNLKLNDKQKHWIKKLNYFGAEIKMNLAADKDMDMDILHYEEDNDTFYFDNSESSLWAPPGTSKLITSLHSIISEFKYKKLCIQKKAYEIKNPETDINFSIIGQSHLKYAGLKLDTDEAYEIFNKEGSVGVCNSNLSIEVISYIQWKIDIYSNDIYLELILVDDHIKTEVYSKALNDGPTELLNMHKMFIEIGYEEAMNIYQTK